MYSARHLGAIESFKRTSSINQATESYRTFLYKCKLTYLRGLVIPELKEEDIPLIKKPSHF